jgi:Pyridoxal-phosphate dependent enzyme
VSLADFPRYPLLFGPSPVHPLERLTAHLGGAAIWAKREDCNSGLAYGGNKTRKLEYLVPDALAQGADTLVSIGGVQSNHTRQVAAVAAKLGLTARLVQESWVDWPDSVNDRVGNILLSRIMGADVRLVDESFGIGVKSSWEQALEEVRAAGGRPYAIPAGASDHRLGGLGLALGPSRTAQQQTLFARYGGSSVPFVDIGNRYILPQAQYLPSALAGLSWTQVAAAMRGPSSAVAKDIDGAANIITAAICSLTHGQPGGVCQSVGVQAAAGSI